MLEVEVSQELADPVFPQPQEFYDPTGFYTGLQESLRGEPDHPQFIALYHMHQFHYARVRIAQYEQEIERFKANSTLVFEQAVERGDADAAELGREIGQSRLAFLRHRLRSEEVKLANFSGPSETFSTDPSTQPDPKRAREKNEKYHRVHDLWVAQRDELQHAEFERMRRLLPRADIQTLVIGASGSIRGAISFIRDAYHDRLVPIDKPRAQRPRASQPPTFGITNSVLRQPVRPIIEVPRQ